MKPRTDNSQTMNTKSILTIVGVGLGIVYLGLMIFEYWWSKKKNDGYVSLKESAASYSTGVIHQGLYMLLPMGTQVYFLHLAYSFAPYKLPFNALHFILAFILADLFYYLQHRLNHTYGFFWSMHQTHHSSVELSLATGARVSWFTPLCSSVILAPIPFLGIHPEMVLLCMGLIFYGQWWCHSRYIPKLGFLEKIINTPSSHRVHHSPKSEHCRSNYAGFFIIWDRMFGTYVSEDQEITTFGTSDGFVGHNPALINLRGPVRYFKSLVK